MPRVNVSPGSVADAAIAYRCRHGGMGGDGKPRLRIGLRRYGATIFVRPSLPHIAAARHAQLAG
ncbi:Uncharacterised protein [Mycobacteroides abscessus subsp. abscessus]|nr:hypothetical protein I544_2334 [Mycobacteroides abscessus subsp. bolletii 103]SKU01835.1 Uncharacterised protein [Mycobacteroides abscessus subsp. abscessus]